MDKINYAIRSLGFNFFKRPLSLRTISEPKSGLRIENCKLTKTDCCKDDSNPDWNGYDDNYVYHHFPFLQQNNHLAVNYLIGAGFETKNKTDNKKINDFFNKTNSIGTKNFEEFTNAIFEMNLSGKAYCYIKDKSTLVCLNDYSSDVLYLLSEDPNTSQRNPRVKIGLLVNWRRTTKEDSCTIPRLLPLTIAKLKEEFLTNKSKSKFLQDEGVQFISNDDLLELGDGKNPLDSNRLLIQMVLDILNLNVESINNRFIEKLKVVLKDGIDLRYLGLDPNIMREDPAKFQKMFEEKIQEVVNDINVTAISDKSVVQQKAIIEVIDTLPRSNKPLDYLQHAYDIANSISASIVGIDPTLLGVRNENQAVSVKPKIQATVLTNIRPKQLMLESQITMALADNLGVGKIELKKVDYVDDLDIAKAELIRAQTQATLVGTRNNEAQSQTDSQEKKLKKEIAGNSGDLTSKIKQKK